MYRCTYVYIYIYMYTHAYRCIKKRERERKRINKFAEKENAFWIQAKVNPTRGPTDFLASELNMESRAAR